MRHKLKFNLECQNFDYYFANEIENITTQQKEELPDELNFKLFRRGGEFEAQSTNKLSFLAKLYVLIKALRKKVILLVEDKNGMNIQDFFKFKENLQKGEYEVEYASDVLMRGFFCLANKEVMETFNHLHNLSISPAYNYIAKIKNVPTTSVSEWKQKSTYVANFFANYESNKKRIVMHFGISMPEFYVLLYLYDGVPKKSSILYKEKYRYAYNSSRPQIQGAFLTLQQRGYVQLIGNKRSAHLKITPSGAGLIDEIFSKYIVDF